MAIKKLKNRIKKSIAVVLVGTIVCSGVGINKLSVSAANTKTYISDIKMITGELTKEVKEKYKGYKFIEKSLSEGGGGTSIYMAYKTTTNSKDAIRDIAFMQMKGNYSASAYEKVLEDNMELAKQSVEDFKCVVEEFRTNYNSPNEGKRKLAKQAYDLLNKYYEEDTGLGMGDFFLNSEGKVSDENYVTLAMQVPSATLSSLISIISKAVDTDENSTWLDRLVSYNGFDGLAKANGFNPDDVSGRKAASDKFESEYGDMIKYLTDEVETSDSEETTCAWDKFAEGLKTYADSLDNTLEEVTSKEELDAENFDEVLDYNKEIISNENAIIYGAIYEVLSNIEYGDGTLVDLFTKFSTDMSKEDFYPIFASLSIGQRTVVLRNGFSVLFTNAGEQTNTNSINADNTVLENNEEDVQKETGKSLVDIQEENADSQLDNVEEVIDTIDNEYPDEIAKEIIIDDKISVYAGVDRSFFDKNIAITTDAQNKDSEGSSGAKKSLPLVTYIAGSIGIASIATSAVLISIGTAPRDVVNRIGHLKYLRGEALDWSIPKGMSYTEALKASEQRVYALDAQIENLQSKAAFAETRTAAAYRLAGTALLVVGLALTTYAIVEAIISLVKKDNPKYTEIPMKMVDSSNGEKTNLEDFLYYNAVQNDGGEAQDLNNWTSGMWLAMYTSKTKDAGGPILADSIKIQKDSNNTVGMESAHLFGETRAYNMLTYSKNSKSQPKLFMYFNRGSSEGSDNIASTFGRNTLIATVSLLVIFCGVVVYEINKNRKKKEFE